MRRQRTARTRTGTPEISSIAASGFGLPRDERIDIERAALRLRPWQFAPSEINDGPSPYEGGSSVGHQAWMQAEAWRSEIRGHVPDYFDGGDE